MATALKAKLDTILEKGGIKQREIAQLLSTTPQTVSRWQTGQTTPQTKLLHRLLILEWLMEQLAQIYEPDDARLWLFSRNVNLGGATPADLIAEDRADEVLRVIDQLQSGAYI